MKPKHWVTAWVLAGALVLTSGCVSTTTVRHAGGSHYRQTTTYYGYAYSYPVGTYSTYPAYNRPYFGYYPYRYYEYYDDYYVWIRGHWDQDGYWVPGHWREY